MARIVPKPVAVRPAPREAAVVPVRTFAEMERLEAQRRAALGSVPIGDNLNLHVGMLKVNRYRREERPLSQTSPLRDVGGSHDRIAAAGLRFSF